MEQVKFQDVVMSQMSMMMEHLTGLSREMAESKKFQNLMMEHMARITQEITELKIGQQKLEHDVAELKQDVAKLKQDVAELKHDMVVQKNEIEELKKGQTALRVELEEVKFRTNLVYNQVLRLTEEQTSTNHRLDSLCNDLKYLKYKENQNEQDLFQLKTFFKITS